MDIAAECDLIVASEDAQFAIAETKRGIHAGPWGKIQWFMQSKVSTEMLLTGDNMPASELYRVGFVNRVVPVGQHLPAAEALAKRILKNPPLSVRAGVRISRYPWVHRVEESRLYFEALRLYLTEDFEEASKAFVEKRPPVFRGR